MLLKLMLGLGLCLPHQLMRRKKVNGDFVLRPKLMNSPVVLGKILRILR
jgi:hypothetical protein